MPRTTAASLARGKLPLSQALEYETRLGAPSPWIEQYSASTDGRRFLMLKPEGDTVRNGVRVILNWPALLQARAR
jgi:hypothetical protein